MVFLNSKNTITNSMENYFSQRASVRKFSDKDISEEKIKAILEAASHAPTTGNMQLYSVIITRNKEKKAQLAPAHFSQPAFMSAPVVLTFCADYNRFVNWCEKNYADPGYDNIQSFIAAALDTVILAQQFVTIAEMEGMGTCYLGTTTYNPEKIAQVLNLPKLVVPIVSLSIGYPAEAIQPTDRIEADGFIHSETYRNYSPEDIDKIYGYKELLPENQKFIAENHKVSLAQVFTDIRYPRSNNEFFSKSFIDFLKKQNFYKNTY